MPREHHATKAEARRAARKAVKLRKRVILIGAVVLAVAVLVVILISGDYFKSSESTPAVVEITVDEGYAEYQAGTFLLDVRTQEEWDTFHIPDTTLIPLDELEDRLGELPQDQKIVVVCNSGNRSVPGAEILLENNFTDVVSMDGGVSAWSEAGYPIEGNRP